MNCRICGLCQHQCPLLFHQCAEWREAHGGRVGKILPNLGRKSCSGLCRVEFHSNNYPTLPKSQRGQSRHEALTHLCLFRHNKVRLKNDNDIVVYENLSGDIRFSKNLPQPNNLNRWFYTQHFINIHVFICKKKKKEPTSMNPLINSWLFHQILISEFKH